jgi:hypothetical protein
MRTSDLRRGGIVGGLLLTVLAIAVLAILAVSYIARNVRINTISRNGRDDVSIETPGGKISVRAHENLDPAAFGVPVYPGARRAKNGGGAVFEWTSSDGKTDKGLSVAGADLITDDPASKVVGYYRNQLPNLLVVTERDGATRLEYNDGGLKRIIVVHEKDDGTHIGVASVGEPASN